METVFDGLRMSAVPQSRLEALIMLGYGSGSSTATKDYNVLINKPKINGVTLVGNLSLEDIGLTTESISSEDLEDMWGD